MVEFDILRAIKAKLELNVLVAHVDIYNAQYENESEEEAFNYPAVFVEFPGSQWVQKFEAQNSGVTASQISEGMNVIVHCCYNSLRNAYDTIDTGLEEFLESVYHDIQGISGANFSELKRINSTQFSPYENVLIWKFTFSTIAEEYGISDSDLTDATDGGEVDLTLVTTKDLLIDNQLIRTGVVANQFTMVDNGSDTIPYTGIPFTIRKTITLNALETENKDFRVIVKWNGYNDQVFNGTLAPGESYSFESTFTFTEVGVGVMQIIGTVFTKNIYDVQVPIPTFSLADNGTDVDAFTNELFTVRKTITRTDSFPIPADYTVIFDWGVLGIETITGTLSAGGSANIESAKTLTGITGSYTVSISGSVTDSIVRNIIVPVLSFSISDIGTDANAYTNESFSIRKRLTRTDNYTQLTGDYSLVFNWGSLGNESFTGILGVGSYVDITSNKALIDILGSFTVNISGAVADSVTRSASIRTTLLYNWYASSDARGLGITGYHIPTQTEYNTLFSNQGGSSVAGQKMKSLVGWTDALGTNTSKYSALGNGYRTSGASSGKGLENHSWTNSGVNAVVMKLFSSANFAQNTVALKYAGANIRLLKNDGIMPTEPVIDLDGNIYTAVQIGAQIWLQQDLRVTKYLNGDSIPDGTSLSNVDWQALITGASIIY